MKIITIKELHDKTGKLVREARADNLVITDHGRMIAVLKRYEESDLGAEPFTARNVHDLPKLDIDSTRLISEDRAE